MENIISSPNESSLRAKASICPCCGHKFEGSLFDGCPSCEAKAVGEPLSRPEIELPSFGRSVLIAAIGGLLLLSFSVLTLIAHLERAAFDLDFWSIVSSMEIAAWRMKWIAIPLAILSIWLGRKICSSIHLQPERFMWSKLAHTGLAASVLFAFLLLTCIGITVPERITKFQLSYEAEQRAKLYLIDKALFDYRKQFGTLPATPSDLKNLPDNDGSIALIISYMEENSSYKPTTDIAKLDPPTRKPIIRNASLTTAADIPPAEKIEFTNYEVRIAGDDGIYGNEDDLIIRDGIVKKAEPLTPTQIPTTLKRVDEKK